MWDVSENGWVYIGAGEIASQLGFTVTRFCCNDYFFLKNPPKLWRVFCGITRFWWQWETWKFSQEIASRFLLA